MPERNIRNAEESLRLLMWQTTQRRLGGRHIAGTITLGCATHAPHSHGRPNAA